MMPRVALVDPDLTADLPAPLTATTGMDALTQLIEAYVSIRATPMTDALATAGIPMAAAALPRAVRDGADRQARSDMALASLWSGMALANAGLGAVHGFAAPIGGRFPAPHGAVCAALLPHVVEANTRALEERGERGATTRFDHVARWLTGHPGARWPEAVEWLRAQVAELAIPRLSRYGLTSADVPTLVDQASRASSMKANPIVLTPDELRWILTSAM
jgi:alcohol dehydrogenase class IV